MQNTALGMITTALGHRVPLATEPGPLESPVRAPRRRPSPGPRGRHRRPAGSTSHANAPPGESLSPEHVVATRERERAARQLLRTGGLSPVPRAASVTGYTQPAAWQDVSGSVRATVHMTPKEIQATALVQLQQLWDRKNREALELWARTRAPVLDDTRHALTGSGAKWQQRFNRVVRPTVAQARTRQPSFAEMFRQRTIAERVRASSEAKPIDWATQHEQLRALLAEDYADPIITLTNQLHNALESGEQVLPSISRQASRVRARHSSRSPLPEASE